MSDEEITRLREAAEDDARTIERLTALGVDGIITNDPLLFDAPS